MSTGIIQMIAVITLIAVAIFLMRWLMRYTIREALAKEGFETSAVFSEVGENKMLTAADEHGNILVAKLSKEPESLLVRIKSAIIPISWESCYWMELADGTRLQAQRI